MNNINIPRYCNGNLVYDEIPMNSIITTSTLGYSYINSNNNGILVKNNNDISFKTFNGILYYKNNELTDCALTDNTLLCTDGAGTLSQINIGGGVLNTYKFDVNSVDTSNQDPSFTDKLVLNNCEIVDDGNQRINKNYLIYGNSSKHGLSPIELDTPSNNYEYYYIVNDLNNNVNISTASQIYTNLYNTVVNQESIQVPNISAIPICKSNETNQQLALIIPKMFDNGNYYIKSDGSYFSLETIYGSILPSSLKTYTKDFNYSNNNILTIGKNNYNEDVFIPIQSSTSLKKPYLSGTGWGDLTYTTFLNSNNLSITKSLIYSNPVVIGTNGSMYGVILPENKKYVLTKSSFKELSITGNDLYINNYPSLNLHKIIQVDNDILSTLSDTTITEIGLLHTKDTGEISISKLTNEDISNNAITTDKIANNAITGNKLLFNDLQTINNWSNIIIDTNGNLYNKHGDFFTNSNKFGVFNWKGDIQSLCANIITEGTMHGNRITQNTLKYDRLNISNDRQTSSWSIIAVNSNNNFITIPNTISVYNNYGVFDYNGNIVKLTADKISGQIKNNQIESINASKITAGTMNGDRISQNTLKYDRLNISNDPQTSSWSIIEVNSNNNFITFSNTLSDENMYGIFNYKGEIVELSADKITSGTFDSNRIAQGAVGSNQLSNLSVTTDKINNNAVTGEKIAQGAVGSNQLSNLSVTTDKINNNAVTGEKIAQGTVGSNQLSNLSVTTEKIKDNAVTGDKIAQGAVSATQISDNSITSSKLNINSSKPSESWKNLLIDNNNNFVTTNASVKNYGVFKYNGVVTELTTQLLTDIGLNLYIPDGNDNEFNQTFVSADYIFYTSTIQDISVNTNYIKVYNYFNSNKFNNNIIYVNNNIRKFVDIYGNIKNTYTAFSSVNNNYQDYNMKFKTSLYIKNAEINLTNYNDYYRYDNNNNISNISNNFFTSSPILIVGVYTSLCKNNEGTQIIILNNKLYKYTYDSYGSNYCKSTLLGYLPLDVSQLKVGNMNNISINKTFDFECTVFSNNKYLDDFNKISDDLLFFVPMYYINNNNEVEQLNYFNKIITNGNDESKYISDFYTNMFIDNKNILNIIDINLNKKEINSNYFYLNDNDLIIKNYNYIGINNEKGNTNLYLIIDQDNNDNNISNIFMNFDNFNKDDIITIVNDLIIFKYFINEPIEKNIKFNISPITKQSNIIYTRTDPESSSHELNKKIEYKFSLCSITASLTKNTGQYPAIIQ